MEEKRKRLFVEPTITKIVPPVITDEKGRPMQYFLSPEQYAQVVSAETMVPLISIFPNGMYITLNGAGEITRISPE